MERLSSLRIGLHIEHPTVLTFVQAMLSLAGHQSLLDNLEEHSLSAYLEMIIARSPQASSPPYDLLILGEVDGATLTDPQVSLALSHLIAHVSPPAIVLT